MNEFLVPSNFFLFLEFSCLLISILSFSFSSPSSSIPLSPSLSLSLFLFLLLFLLFLSPPPVKEIVPQILAPELERNFLRLVPSERERVHQSVMFVVPPSSVHVTVSLPDLREENFPQKKTEKEREKKKIEGERKKESHASQAMMAPLTPTSFIH